MEARTELHGHLRLSAGIGSPRPLALSRKAAIATGCGIAGGLGFAVPVVLYDWARTAHAALELPMAATAWLFGLSHFTQNGYLWWPIVLGVLFLLVYWIAQGTIFGAVADRFLELRTLPETIGAGLAWGFVSWLAFWYTLLPIARDGAPFRATVGSALVVAPTWIYILGSAVLGVTTSLAYWVMRKR